MAAKPSVESQEKSGIDTNLQRPEEQLVEDVRNADEEEKNLKFLEAIKLYPKAVGWSVLLSTAIIMEGYDLKLIPQMFAQPAFNQTYGTEASNGNYTITAEWQAGLSNGTTVGALLGLFLGGYLADRFGFRKTMIGALSAVTAIIFLQFFAQNLPMLQASQILMGKVPPVTPVLSPTHNPFRYSPGNLPVDHDPLCRRDYPDVPSGLSDHLCESLLGRNHPRVLSEPDCSSSSRSLGRRSRPVSCAASSSAKTNGLSESLSLFSKSAPDAAIRGCIPVLTLLMQMGLASSPDHRHLPRPRVAVVACPT